MYVTLVYKQVTYLHILNLCIPDLLLYLLINGSVLLITKYLLNRDWRGLAHLCYLGAEMIPMLASDEDQASRILNIVQTRIPDFTLKNLLEALEKLGRWDIVDDSIPDFGLILNFC